MNSQGLIKTLQQHQKPLLITAFVFFLGICILKAGTSQEPLSQYINVNAQGKEYPFIPVAAKRVAGVNPVTGTRYDLEKCEIIDEQLHHPSLLKFNCWSGEVPAGGALFHPIGGFAPTSVWKRNPKDAPLYKAYHQKPILPPPSKFGEEYVQVIAAAEAVLHAKDQFVAIELGAAFGRWLLTAFHFNMQKHALPTLLIGLEGDVLRQKQFKAAMSYNSLRDHEVILFEGVVADHDGEAYFCGSGSSSWYGQTIVKTADNCKSGIEGVTGTTTRVRAMSLKSILEPLYRVDYLDMDVQYSEMDVVMGAKEEIDKKVKRIIIEVHDVTQLDEFVDIFEKMGWEVKYAIKGDTGYDTNAQTVHGNLKVSGGMFYAVNTRLQ